MAITKPDLKMTTFLLAMIAPLTAYAEAPVLKSGTPVIYLADNLDEPEKLGWCIDTEGRGFAETLQSHSCKPTRGKANDTQFSHEPSTGLIRSVAFPDYCMELSDPGSSTHPFSLVKCDAASTGQVFGYDEASMEIHFGGDHSMCVVVATSSIKAGPFRSRDLIQAKCNGVEAAFKQWVVKK